MTDTGVRVLRRGPLVVSVVGPRAWGRPPHPEERALCASRSPARRADFLAGRRAAAFCLAELGRSGPVLAAPDGRPLFPSGLSGSISHSGGWAACAAGVGVPAVGVDLERRGRVPLAGLRHVCAPEEEPWIRAAPDEAEADRRATAMFAAKEALYKARDTLPGPRPRLPELRLRVTPYGFTTVTETAGFLVRMDWLGAYVLAVAVPLTASVPDRRTPSRSAGRPGGPGRLRTDA